MTLLINPKSVAETADLSPNFHIWRRFSSLVRFGSHEFVAAFAMSPPGRSAPVDRDVWLGCPDTDATTTFLGLAAAAAVSRRLLPCAIQLERGVFRAPQNHRCKKYVTHKRQCYYGEEILGCSVPMQLNCTFRKSLGNGLRL